MIFFEKERSNKEFYVYHQSDVNLTFPLHIHDSIEFVGVIDGELDIVIEGNKYTLNKNNCAIILPDEAHEYITNTYSKSYLCVCSKDHVPYFCNFVENKRAENPIFYLENLDEIIHQLKNPTNTFFLKSTIYYILGYFADNTKFIDIEKNNKSFLHICVNYINENYMYDITLHDLARELGYTYNYCSMLFNKSFTDSFSYFLNECRISYASTYLLETNKTISEIALICGFNSLRVFNRNFLKFKGETPSEFRKANKIN